MWVKAPVSSALLASAGAGTGGASDGIAETGLGETGFGVLGPDGLDRPPAMDGMGGGEGAGVWGLMVALFPTGLRR